MTPEENAKKLEPIYSTYFDVEFTSVDLTEDERQTLHDCVKSVIGKDITFGLYYEEKTKKIVPIDALSKLKASEKKSDVIISILNNDSKMIIESTDKDGVITLNTVAEKGKILGTLIYKECNMSVDFSGLLAFRKMPKNDLGLLFAGDEKEVTLSLHSSTILYNNQEI